MKRIKNGGNGGIVTETHTNLTGKIKKEKERAASGGIVVRFSGAARAVSGSLHILESGGKVFFLDCGLYQGRREDMYFCNAQMPVEAAQVEGVLLSHAHIDHSGRLPRLVHLGYRGPIYATAETIELCTLLLYDCAYVVQTQTARLNHKRVQRGLSPLPALFTQEDVAQTLRQMVPVEWSKPREIASGTDAEFLPAGHILGASQIVIHRHDSCGAVRLMYTGDLGRSSEWILPVPAHVSEIQHLIVESTYGDMEHRPYTYARSGFRDALRKTIEAGGVVILPAFSVGRTQRMMYETSVMIKTGEIPHVPVYLDSPLSVRASEVFFSSCEVQDALADDPYGAVWPVCTPVETARESRRLIDSSGPYIVITASGMCEAGRILHHLERRLPDPQSRVIFVGFCTEGTLGRQLIEGQKTVRIRGKAVRVEAQIDVFNTFSAHADKTELRQRIRSLPHLHSVFIVHGEERKSFAVADMCTRETNAEVIVPFPGETFRLTADGIDNAA